MRLNIWMVFVCIVLFSSCIKNLYVGSYEGDEPSRGNINLPNLGVPNIFNWNEVYVKIPLTSVADENNIKVSFPALKYNKDFVYSYTFDDCTAMAYGKAFCTINKKKVDNEQFYHVGQGETVGEIPTKFLGYTDGCGNEFRFSFGVSIWPNLSNSQIDNIMNPSKDVTKYYPYLVWSDIVPIVDFGGALYFHNIASTFDEKDVASVMEGLKSDNVTTQKMIGRKMKVLARPDGKDEYITAARQLDDIVFMTLGGYITDIGNVTDISFDKDLDLKNVAQPRRYVEATPDVDILMESIEKKRKGKVFPWIHDFSHGPEGFQFILDYFARINDVYGKDGDDCIWIATLDEVYEYNYLKRNLEIEKEIVNDTLILKFKCNSSDLPDNVQYYRDFSILMTGVDIQPGTKLISGDNVYGLSYGKNNGDTWLLNINCNKSLLERSKRYTEIYKKKLNSFAKEDALYFINQLKEEWRESFLEKIN